MIINIGNRTDIPAFYSDWFFRRLEEGSVCVRNPYAPELVTRYRLDPEVVDCLIFCTKNPAPMFSRFDGLDPFRQVWFVTITPYGPEIEPFVPPFPDVIQSFRDLSSRVGKKSVIWRYDPVFLSGAYNLNFHLETFEHMASLLAGFTEVCVISFVDLYRKTLRNFRGVQDVPMEKQFLMTKSFVRIAARYGMKLKTCAESPELAGCGADVNGCIMQRDLESITDERYVIPVKKSKRDSCSCLLDNEIGAYNSCPHGCLYCYANENREDVIRNRKNHDPESPLLIGCLYPEDKVADAVQKSYLDKQFSLF